MRNTSVLNGNLPVRLQGGALLLTFAVLAGLEMGLARGSDVRLPLLVACVVSGIALLGARRLQRTLTAAEAERERIELSLRRSEEYHKVFRRASDALLIVDAEDLRVCDANERACLVYDLPREMLVGHSLHDMNLDARKLEDAIQRLRTGEDGTQEFEMVHTRADETAVNLQVTVSPLRFYNRQAVLCVSRDVSDRKTLEAQLSHQAFHDPLTGLANRALFKDRVEHAFARAVRNPRPVIVLFLDLDNFKKINDSLGHDAGDQLLVEVARRILACVRVNDTVARLGGDEFAVLLDGASVEDSVRVAERILEDLPISYTIEDNEVVVGTSIGIADSGTGSNAEDLLRNADAAMYRAKGSGKGRYAVFEPDMHTQAVDQFDLEVGLRRALQRAEFTLHYQPIVDFQTGQLAGFEALVRWNHPERGLLAPHAFIPLAEETGLIVALGRWVLMEACMRVRQWQVRYSTGFPLMISVNVSGRQITEPDFVETVEAALRQSGLAAESLVLEITESVVIERTGPVLGRLQQLRNVGVRIAIDDFGTGYSSLSAIHTLPVDVLKIDRSFVAGMEAEGGDCGVLRAILNLGETLGLCTVAEGIETEHQRLQLQSLGCQLGQGFYLGRPLSSPEVVTLLYESMSELPLTA